MYWFRRFESWRNPAFLQTSGTGGWLLRVRGLLIKKPDENRNPDPVFREDQRDPGLILVWESWA